VHIHPEPTPSCTGVHIFPSPPKAPKASFQLSLKATKTRPNLDLRQVRVICDEKLNLWHDKPIERQSAHIVFDYWLTIFVGTADEARGLFCNDSNVQLIEAVA
jgi:hypothetical protein